MPNHQHDPLNEFMANLNEAEHLITKIRMHVLNHLDTDPEAVTWANVGDANHVKEMLQAVLNFIENKE